MSIILSKPIHRSRVYVNVQRKNIIIINSWLAGGWIRGHVCLNVISGLQNVYLLLWSRIMINFQPHICMSSTFADQIFLIWTRKRNCHWRNSLCGSPGFCIGTRKLFKNFTYIFVIYVYIYSTDRNRLQFFSIRCCI